MNGITLFWYLRAQWRNLQEARILGIRSAQLLAFRSLYSIIISYSASETGAAGERYYHDYLKGQMVSLTEISYIITLHWYWHEYSYKCDHIHPIFGVQNMCIFTTDRHLDVSLVSVTYLSNFHNTWHKTKDEHKIALIWWEDALIIRAYDVASLMSKSDLQSPIPANISQLQLQWS